MAAPAPMEFNIVDTKVLGKPSIFYGKDSEFHDWNFSLTNYLGCLRSDVPTMMEIAAKQKQPIPMDVLTPEQTQICKSLYYVLSMLVKKKALKIVKKLHKEKNGFEAYRKLCIRFDPEHAGRTMVKLQNILHPTWNTEELDEFEDEIETWEEQIEQYEEMSKEELSDNTKKAVIMKFAPENIKQHMALNASSVADYETAKTIVLGFIQSQKNWEDAKDPPTKHKDKMEVDHVGYVGYGKDRGKGKGKDKGKGKGKGKKGKGKGKGKDAYRTTYANYDKFQKGKKGKGKGREKGK